MDSVAFATRALADFLLLIGPAEVEPRHVPAAGDFPLAEHQVVGPASDLLEDRVVVVERVAALIDVGWLHRIADAERAGVRFLLADDHAEESSLARSVRADDADDPAT